MLQSTVRLSNNDSLRRDPWISLGKGNRIDFMGGLGVGGDEDRSNQMGKGRLRLRVQGETMEIMGYLGVNVEI